MRLVNLESALWKVIEKGLDQAEHLDACLFQMENLALE